MMLMDRHIDVVVAVRHLQPGIDGQLTGNVV